MSQVNHNRAENARPFFGPVPDAATREPTLASRTAEQVHGILRAADRQADEIRRQVEEWASTRVRDIEAEALSYLDEARARSEALVAERLDPIVALGTLVEERAERLMALLEAVDSIKSELHDLIKDLRESPNLNAVPLPDGTTGSAVPSAAAPLYGGAVAQTPTWSPGESAQEPDDEGARLLALQMAIDGSPRSEVEQRIRDEFDVRNPAAILDEVFGAGTKGSHRIAWNVTRRIG